MHPFEDLPTDLLIDDTLVGQKEKEKEREKNQKNRWVQAMAAAAVQAGDDGPDADIDPLIPLSSSRSGSPTRQSNASKVGCCAFLRRVV